MNKIKVLLSTEQTDDWYDIMICKVLEVIKWSQALSWYDTKQSDGDIPVMLENWGVQATPSLPLFPGQIWPGMVAPDKALSMG